MYTYIHTVYCCFDEPPAPKVGGDPPPVSMTAMYCCRVLCGVVCVCDLFLSQI